MRSAELFTLALVACSNSNTATPVTHPALTFDQACAAEGAFARTNTSCLNCIATVELPACSCRPSDPFSGKCETESVARTHTADCTSTLDSCVAACKADCTCQKACYAGHDACLAATEKRDSCVVDVCASVCK